MKTCFFSLTGLVVLAVVFIVGAKWGTGIVSQIPVVNSL
jgi:hypothetical protein